MAFSTPNLDKMLVLRKSRTSCESLDLVALASTHNQDSIGASK